MNASFSCNIVRITALVLLATVTYFLVLLSYLQLQMVQINMTMWSWFWRVLWWNSTNDDHIQQILYFLWNDVPNMNKHISAFFQPKSVNVYHSIIESRMSKKNYWLQTLNRTSLWYMTTVMTTQTNKQTNKQIERKKKRKKNLYNLSW